MDSLNINKKRWQEICYANRQMRMEGAKINKSLPSPKESIRQNGCSSSILSQSAHPGAPELLHLEEKIN
jgi:hypothetical protein